MNPRGPLPSDDLPPGGILPPGSVHTLIRRIDASPDPLALFRHLTRDASARDTLLLESADAVSKEPVQSLIIPHAAVRAVARQRRVTLSALTRNGQHAVSAIAHQFARHGAPHRRSESELVLTFPPPPAHADDRTRIRAPSPLDVLRAMGQRFTLVHSAAKGCLINAGVFAYDLLDNFEPLPEAHDDPLGYPDYAFWLAESVIRVDHRARQTQIACHVFGAVDRHAVRSVHDDARRRLEQLVGPCANTAPHDLLGAHERSMSRPIPTGDADLSDEDYADLVRKLKQRIVAGDVFQIVPSRTFSAPCTKPLDTYAALKQLNPSPYMFYVAANDHTLFGASPETAIKVSHSPAKENPGRRILQIRPIAGTRQRGRHADGRIDLDLDNRLEVELRLHEKEVAEHMMLVDLARNDVARVSRPGTRHVDEILTTERYSHVMHLVSNVSGELAQDLDELHAYQASMNMGTLVGAPKVRAAQILRECEPTKRGPYGGAVGYTTEDGELDTAIIIRSAIVKNDIAYVRAGAGVVYDSDPHEEADETKRKAASVLTALAEVEPKRTS
ncbi:MAG: anthranilate synthase component 1 [Nannocystaceae bacterium]